MDVKNSVKKAYGTVSYQKRTGLFENLDNLSTPHSVTQPKSMEAFHQSFGYILYRSNIESAGTYTLDIVGGADRIHYFLNQEQDDIRYDSSVFQYKTITAPTDNTTLDLLVENMGRVNFGYNMNAQRKGIRGPVLLDHTIQQDFTVYPLPMDNLDQLDYRQPYQEGLPSFTTFMLSVDTPEDTFLQLDGFGKGFVTINGHNLGRYYVVGPQQTLYVPAPYLKKGENEIIVFESDGRVADTITFIDHPILG
jgi:beta-galactosidase